MFKLEINQFIGKKISKKFLARVFKTVFVFLGRKKGQASLAFVDSKTIKRLNYLYRGKNESADILTFAEIDVKRKEKGTWVEDKDYLGEVVISLADSQKKARKYGQSAEERLLLLLVHGFLHLAGFKHKTKKEREKMEKAEKRIIFQIANKSNKSDRSYV